MVKKTCCSQCSNHCATQVHIDKNGRILKVQPDEQSPFGKGGLCIKSSIATEFHDYPGRFNFPLKRVGKRGEGKWQPISWDQALDEIAQKIGQIRHEYGPQAIAVMGGDRRPGDAWAQRWCNLFGSPNLFFQGKNCASAQIVMDCAVLGYPTQITGGVKPGVTQTIVAWGHNPAESFHRVWNRILEAKAQGAKVVVIDPRRTETARLADLFLQLRPGTDGALGLAIIKVMIENSLYDRNFVSKYCQGLGDLASYVSAFPLKRAEEITWVPQEKIWEAARLISQAPCHISWGVATAQLGGGDEGCPVKSAVQAKAILKALSGSLDIPGGNPFMDYPDSLALHEVLGWDRQFDILKRGQDSVGAERFPLSSIRGYRVIREAMAKVYPRGFPPAYFFLSTSSQSLWQAILQEKPYPLKALIAAGANPLLSLGNSREIYQALKSSSLSLFVVMDLVKTPSGMLADYLLPAADGWERPFFSGQFGFSDSYFAAEQVVDPLYERRPDYALWEGLGNRLGQKGEWPDLPLLYDKILAPAGVTFQELAKRKENWIFHPKRYQSYEEEGFGTFSGKVEFIPQTLSRLGYDPLPRYSEPPRTPLSQEDLAKAYPLILISGGRRREYYHSSYRDLSILRRRVPDPLVEIHPQTAVLFDIREGDWVKIQTPEGEITQKARITDGIHPRVIHADSHWWYPEKKGTDPELFGVRESNINWVLPAKPNFFSFQGDNALRALIAKVERK